MSFTATTTLQELLQCEEGSFIPDDLDDKFYDDNTYNWEEIIARHGVYPGTGCGYCYGKGKK